MAGFPQPQQLPNPQAGGSPLLAILSGLAQAPEQHLAMQNLRQQQAQMLQEQKQQMEMQKFQMQAMQRVNAENAYKDLATKGRNDAAFAASPMYSAQAQQIESQTGIPGAYSIDDKGAKVFDGKAYLERPGVNLDTMDPQQSLLALQMDPKQRKVLFPNVYSDKPDAVDAFYSAPATNPPPTEAAENLASQTLEKYSNQMATKGTPPRRVAELIKASAPIFERAGWHIQDLIDPTKPFMSEPMSSYVQNQTARIMATIQHDKEQEHHWGSQDDISRRFKERQMHEMGVHDEQADRRIQQADSKLAMEGQNLQLALRKANLNYESVKSLINYRQTMTSLASGKLSNANLQMTLKQLQAAAATQEAVVRTANTIEGHYMEQNAAPPDWVTDELDNDPNATDPQTGQPKQNALTKLGEINTAILNLKGDIQTNLNSDITNNLGHDTVVAPKASDTNNTQPLTGTSKSGKPIESTDGGKTWHYKQ